MKLRDLKESRQEIEVGSYYVLTRYVGDMAMGPTTMLVTELYDDDDGRIADFEYIENGEVKEYDWYVSDLEEQARPATEEEIKAFVAARRAVDKKFLDNLKDNDKEEE